MATLELNLKAKRNPVQPVWGDKENSKAYWLNLVKHFESYGMASMAKMCNEFAEKAPND